MTEPRRNPPPAKVHDEGDDYLQPSPLSIIHFLLWTTIAAGLFSLQAWSVQFANGVDADYEKAVLILDYGSHMLVAAGLTGAIVLLRARLRRSTGRFQPGHWLVLIQSGFSLTLAVASFAMLAAIGDDALPLGHLTAWDAPFVLVPAFGTVACVWVACRRVWPDRWALIFIVFAVRMATLGLHNFVFPLCASNLQLAELLSEVIDTLGGNVLLCLALGWAAWRDVRTGSHRDWIHGWV